MTRKELKEYIKKIIIEMNEAPISSFTRIGDWSRNSSYKDLDRRLLTSPKAIEKIKRQWQKTDFNFDIYVINDPRVNKPDFREVGVVDEDFVRNQMRITEEEIPEFSSSNITVLFTSNVGDQKVMQTGWILAHRLSHAIFRGRNFDKLNKILYFVTNEIETLISYQSERYSLRARDAVYGSYQQTNRNELQKYVREIFYSLGTMKSVRDRKLRNIYEFVHELFAQWLIEGKVTLNRINEHGYLGKFKLASSDWEAEMLNDNNIESIEHYLETQFSNLLGEMEGKILVM